MKRTYHLLQPPRCNDVARMHETVEVAGRFLNRFAHVIFTVKIEDVRDEVESILVVLNFGIEAREIEAVR